MIKFIELQVRRGSQILLDQGQAVINPKQKVGLVGKNGCGKSTLLSLIKKELQPELGEIQIPNHWALAWVLQETPALDVSALEYVLDGDREYRQLSEALEIATKNNDGLLIAQLHEKLEVIGAWTIHARASQLLAGLGFSETMLQSAVKDFSGGWRMRLNLAQALLCRSDLLLLDEPTNHLDLDAVIWLEKWLQSYPGTLILISHDRDFIDPICDKIIHIERQQLFEYTGNYSDFERQRAMKLAQHQALVEAQQEKKAHLQSYIDRFRAKASKAKQAQSRIKMLEKMDELIPLKLDRGFEFEFPTPDALPNPLLQMDKVSAGYGDKIILSSIKLNLVPGSRIGLLGRNGAGKSTLVKLLAGELEPTEGKMNLAKGISLGYFAQHQLEYLDPEGSPLLHLQRIAPKETEQKLRNFLGGFAFQGDKVLEPTRIFSGGEKARLVLALIIWQKPNLLLLDEPTNHLDLEMRDALTDALIGFEGALIVVSHDRHLLRAVTEEFYLVDSGKVTLFDGDLVDYQKWTTEQQKLMLANDRTNDVSVSVASEDITSLSAVNRKEQKKKEAELRAKSAPLRKKIAAQEKIMQTQTEQLEKLEQLLGDNALYTQDNKDKLQEALQAQNTAKQLLEQAETLWFEYQSLLEDME